MPKIHITNKEYECRKMSEKLLYLQDGESAQSQVNLKS